ncbi:MAG: amidohydrolase family protein [Planctomycetes bacterium]|nr:amidohydrolase family protein [Planctomycetota bacterium]
MSTVRMHVLLVLSALLLAACPSPMNRLTEARSGTRPADLVIANADVFTASEKNPWVEVLAVKDGRVAYAGPVEGAEDFVGPDTEVMDGRGGMVVPGLADAHCHPLYIGGLRGVMADLYAANSLEEMSSTIEDWARKNADLPFVLGIGWRLEHIADRNPGSEYLDRIFPDRPAFLWSYDGHSGWVNSAGVARMRERNPRAFRAIAPRLDDKGNATGFFLHFFDFNPFDYFSDEEIGEPTRKRILAGMEAALDEARKAGVTTVHDIQVSRRFLPLVLRFRDEGGMKDIRVRCSLYVPHYALEDEAAFVRELEWWKEVGKSESSDHFRLGESVKLYIDGVFANHTALMAEPYLDGAKDSGEPVWKEAALYERAIEWIDRMGIQACTHGCGDEGIRRIVGAYEKAIAKNGARDARHAVEHCELPAAAEQKRMAELGIYASMQPVALYADEPTFEGLGIDRLQGYMPWRSMKEAGVPLAFGSDWCAAPFNPIYGLLVASLRYNYQENSDWGPEERLEIEETLAGYTLGGARALHWEDQIGSLEVGKRADFSLYEIDLREIDSTWFLLWHDAELGALDDFVRMTCVDGRVVYERS